mgnify:CR=1 FL=1
MKKFHYLDTIISPNITEKSTDLSKFKVILFIDVTSFNLR